MPFRGGGQEGQNVGKERKTRQQDKNLEGGETIFQKPFQNPCSNLSKPFKQSGNLTSRGGYRGYVKAL